MSAPIFVLPRQQPLTNNLTALPGSKLRFYRAGSTTPQTVYTDSQLTVPHTNPVVANAFGFFEPIYLDATADYDYRVVLLDEDDVQQWSYDNYPKDGGLFIDPQAFGRLINPRTATEISLGITPTDYTREVPDPRRYGFVGNNSADDTAALQAAINVASASGGGRVRLPCGSAARITSVLDLKTEVTLDLNWSTIWQVTDNIPIVRVASNATNWAMLDGALIYVNQQSAAQTGALGFQLGQGSSTNYLGYARGVTVSRSYRGFTLPFVTGAYTFMFTMEQCYANDCSDWGVFIQGDTGSGGATNIKMSNVWVLQTAGSEQPGSKGFAMRGVSQLTIDNIATDHIQTVYGLWLENCTTTMQSFLAESCEFVTSTGIEALVLVDGGTLNAGLIAQAANTVDVAGGATFAMLRMANGAQIQVGALRDVQTTKTGAGTYKTVYATFNDTCRAEIFHAISASGSPALSIEDTTVPRRQILRWGNADRLPLYNEATYDPANLVDGAGVTTTVTVTGAALGNRAEATFSLDLQGILMQAWVSSSNTVSVRFQNETGGAIDLASGTIAVSVWPTTP